jgi:tetratricopeptide (TPR) repeat protein
MGLVLALGAAAATTAPGARGAESPSGLPSPPSPPSPEPDTSPAGRAHTAFEQGLVHYVAHDFETAVAIFGAAFALDPRPEYLFAAAQALRLKGDCPQAVRAYRRFLETHPSPVQVQATKLGLDRCAFPTATAPSAGPGPASPPGLAPEPIGAPAPPPAGAPPSSRPPDPFVPSPPPSEAARPPSTSSRLVRDPLVVVSFSGALVCLGTGVGLWVASSRDLPSESAQSPTGATSYAGFAQAWQTAESRRALAIGALSAGAALGVAGAARAWWVLGRRGLSDARAPLRSAGPQLVFDGHTLALRGAY